MQLVTYPNKLTKKPDFFIQTKGEHSGRPLRTPIKNCVAVYSDIPNLFEIVFILFRGRKFEPVLRGSVIPFITVADLKRVILEGLENNTPEKSILLKSTKDAENMIRQAEEKVKLLRSLQILLCNKFLG